MVEKSENQTPPQDNNPKGEQPVEEPQTEPPVDPPEPEEYESKTLVLLDMMEDAGINVEELSETVQKDIKQLKIATDGFTEWDERNVDLDEKIAKTVRWETKVGKIAPELEERAKQLQEQIESEKREAQARKTNEDKVKKEQKKKDDEAKKAEEENKSQQAKQDVVNKIVDLYKKGKSSFNHDELEKLGVPIKDIEKKFGFSWEHKFEWGGITFREEPLSDTYEIEKVGSGQQQKQAPQPSEEN